MRRQERGLNGGRGQGRGQGNIRGGPAPRGRRPRSQERDGRQPFAIGYMALKSLSENTDSEDLMMKILNERSGFGALLSSATIKPDFFPLTVIVLKTVLSSHSTMAVLRLVKDSEFLNQLQAYILRIELQDGREKMQNNELWKDCDGFLNDVFLMCRVMFERSNFISCEPVHKVLQALRISIPRICAAHNLPTNEDLLVLIESLFLAVDSFKNEIQPAKATTSAGKDKSGVSNYVAPSDDFRTIDIYPSCAEITSPRSFYLNENRLRGAYESVDQYLDVQFRLLREDFVSPLREAVQAFKAGEHKRTAVRVYKEALYLEMHIVNGVVCHRVQFRKPGKNQKRINPKRFMFGALVCISWDNFETAHFATVAERTDDDLLKGCVVIQLMSTATQLPKQHAFVLLECEVYFEPYCQVLGVLQHMPADAFPMRRYIVDMQTEPRLPDYLADHPNETYTIERRTFRPAVEWPERAFYGLNESQGEAFKAALTREMAVVQGPPGTGKTFVGLKIAEVLLRNQETWYNRSPMLVICYTNHALDQFLEGVAEITEDIVRVGSRSNNEKLDKFNLRNIRIGRNEALRQASQKVKETKEVIDDLEKRLKKLDDRNCLWDVLAPYFNSGDIVWNTVDWLLGIRNIESVVTIEEAINKHEHYKLREIIVLAEMEEVFAERRDYIPAIMTLLQTPCNVDLTRRPPPHMTLNRVPMNTRWTWYNYILHQYRLQLMGRKELYMERYRAEYEKYEELRNAENVLKMKEHLVVGMTTTGAARNYSALAALRSPIVIVEEAAEVLEAHIITALTKDCKHLILIGDHQQLRPSAADYHIETKLNLGVSLFERLIMNGAPLCTLNVQHRMRPEIARLISPHIYPQLRDHESTLDRPQIRGIAHPLRFVDHRVPELAGADDDDAATKRNEHEADFLIALARHLAMNGYKPDQITILAAYLGQMYEILERKRRDPLLLKDVRVAVLDNYQGEECDIILLSLVRNNAGDAIGFLKQDNRVCVALSRARNGFYIMGNMEMLAKRSQLWGQVRDTLIAQNALSDHLVLRCENHRDTYTQVRTAQDFEALPEGGCTVPCDLTLPCGHACPRRCHPYDRDHATVKCLALCGKLLCERDPTHTCRLMCYEECPPCNYKVDTQLDCGHTQAVDCSLPLDQFRCPALVVAKLPCDHEAEKPCHKRVDKVRCPHECESRVESCGHACIRTCHFFDDPDHLQYKCRKACQRPATLCSQPADQQHPCRKLCFEECDECTVKVLKQRTTCQHMVMLQCRDDVDALPCLKPCKRPLPCEHVCKRKCNEPCDSCTVLMDKTVEDCGHKVKVPCDQPATRWDCKGQCPRTKPCGHLCNSKCLVPCDQTPCTTLVECALKSPCGHTVTRLPCHLLQLAKLPENVHILLEWCPEPCRTTLPCEHPCTGTCGGCRQGRVHQRCRDKCRAILVCNHECAVPCSSTCEPCKRKCTFRCVHSHCTKLCGEVCTPCKERCTRGCQHGRCNRLCSQICSIPPCNLPCDKQLKCGHPCVGLCGDPCPQLCRICNRDELTELFFGTEDEDDAQFVLLADCGHVLESTALEQWFTQSGSEIGLKACPKCSTTIINTQRYSDHVKQALTDMDKVKLKVTDTTSNNMKTAHRLQAELDKLPACATHKKSWDLKVELIEVLSAKGKKQNRITQLANQLNSIEAKVQILKCITNAKNIGKNVGVAQLADTIIDIISGKDVLTAAQRQDISMELLRFQRLDNLASLNAFLPDDKRAVQSIREQLTTIGPFSEQLNSAVQAQLAKLKHLASSLNISNEERVMILQVMNMSRGHWYKCPNGHVYCIGDCGGAMQESKCPECGAIIGGGSHRLRYDNAVATEMDGATHSAWSEANNMGNYENL